MQKIILALAAIIGLTACNDDKTASSIKKEAFIAGTITAIDTIAVPEKLSAYLYNDLTADYDEIDIKVSEDGSFAATFPIEKTMSIAVYGDYGVQLITSPGDSIVIKTNTRFDNISFSGKGERINTLLKEYKDSNPTDHLMEGKDALSTTAYTAHLDSVLKIIKSFNADFIAKNNHPILKDYIESEEVYFIPAKKLLYALFTSPKSEKPLTDSIFMESFKNYPFYKESYDVNTDNAATAAIYLEYLWEKDAQEEGDIAKEKAFMEGLMSLENNDYLQKKLLQSKVMYQLENNNITFYENNKATIDKVFAGNTIATSITSKYKEVKDLLDNPDIPKDAQLLTFNSEDPSLFIDEIIANANGKVVYIDNWATWCGPCKSEFKTASPALHEKFKEDVEFVYLCHQSKKATYIPSISKYKIAGKHYFLENEESKPIFNQIDLKGFPTYTIINKRGEIVLSDHIHRPSFAKTTEILTGLINEEL